MLFKLWNVRSSAFPRVMQRCVRYPRSRSAPGSSSACLAQQGSSGRTCAAEACSSLRSCRGAAAASAAAADTLEAETPRRCATTASCWWGSAAGPSLQGKCNTQSLVSSLQRRTLANTCTCQHKAGMRLTCWACWECWACWACWFLRITNIQPLTMEDDHDCLNQL